MEPSATFTPNERSAAHASMSCEKTSKQRGLFEIPGLDEQTGEDSRMTPQELKQMRTSLKLTQSALASVLGVTPTTIHRYESGLVKISGIVEQKLLQLKFSVEDPRLFALLINTLSRPLGTATVAGLLAFSVACVPVTGLIKLGLAGALIGQACQEIGNIHLQQMEDKNGTDEIQLQSSPNDKRFRTGDTE